MTSWCHIENGQCWQPIFAFFFGESSVSKVATVGINEFPRAFKVSSRNRVPMHLGAVSRCERHPSNGTMHHEYLQYCGSTRDKQDKNADVSNLGTPYTSMQNIAHAKDVRSMLAICSSILLVNARCSSLYISESSRWGGHSCGVKCPTIAS